MRRNLGFATGIFALLAVAVHTMNPPRGERDSSFGSGQEGASKKKDSNDEDKRENAREGPWLATRAFFGTSGGDGVPSKDDDLEKTIAPLSSPKNTVTDPSALQSLFGVDSSVCSSGSWSIVATVADPVHTRLALFFDGQVDSIERAAEEDGWVFARQWLPWLDPFDGSEPDINVRRQQRRLERGQESLPGILAFRSDTRIARTRCLFVLLVPENPTGGVSEDSLTAALNIADLLSPGTRIGLLAPSFSGSFPSLAHGLSRWLKGNSRNKDRLYSTAYGGSVSSRFAATILNTQTNLSFRSGILSGIDIARGLSSLLGTYGIPEKSVAYLVEQESGYSSDEASAIRNIFPEAVVYEFPRDISHLRNAYQRATPSTGGRYPNAIPSIELSLNDPSRGEDSIPVFSDTDTPVVQSAEVGAIAEDLKRRGIRLAYIGATNSLDELFLAQFLRQQTPNVRVIVGGDTDLLFLPAASQRSLTGTLFMSTYPMSFAGDEALAANPQFSRYSLPSENLQGLFNVTKLLLWHFEGNGAQPPKGLRGYAGLKPDDSRYPGVWMLELTRFGFSPVDWIKAPGAAGWMEESPAGQASGELSQPFASAGWYITSRLTGFAIIAGCIIFVRLKPTNRISWPVWRRSGGETAVRFPLFAAACLFLSSVPWVLGVPAYLELAKAPRGQNLTVVLLLVAFAAPLMCLMFITAMRAREPRRSFYWYLTALLSFLLWLFILIVWWRSCDGPDAGHSMFRWRALHLYSSASPTVPFLLVSLIFAGGLFAEFYRRSETGRTSPHLKLDRTGDIPAFKAYYSEVNQLIAGKFRPSRLVTCIFVTGVSMFLLVRQLPAFESEYYNLGLRVSIAVLIWALASLGCDAVLIWFNLSKMLVLIESIPLRNVFIRIARAWPRREVWAFWKSTPGQTLAVQMSEALHNRNKAGTDKGGDLAVSFFGLTRDRFAGDPEADLDTYFDARSKYEENAAYIAEDLFVDDLWPKWKDSPIDNQAIDESNETVPAKEHRFEADFVALHCCHYLTYVVHQTQRAVWTISFLLVLLIGLLNSYSAQGPLFVGRYIVVMFLAATCIVAYVFAGMERNWVLSQISHTKPGELNADFWLHIGALGILPLIGLIVHLFPDVSTFLYSWVAPGIESAK